MARSTIGYRSFVRFVTKPVIQFTTVVVASLSLSRAHANVVGAGTQNFNPVTDGLDYVTVHSSKTLRPGLLNVGGFLNHAVNSLPYVDTAAQGRTKFNDTLTSSDVNVGFGLLSNVDAGVSLPAVLAQSVDQNSGTFGRFVSTGSTEVRINGKWRFFGDDRGGFATVLSANFLRIKDDPYAGVDAGPTYNFEFVADRTFANGVNAAVNIGRRFLNSGTPVPGSFIEPMRDQWIASVAASYLFQKTDTKLIGEVFGAVPARSSGRNPARNNTSAELLVGVKHDFTTDLAGHVGVGSELIQGVSSPDWRVYAGLNFTFGPVWNRESSTLTREQETESVSTFKVGNILFEFNSAKMTGDYEAILADLVAELKRRPFRRLTIEGHTDSVGSIPYNTDLSQRRADAIRDYLVKSAGIPAPKITAVGLGPSRPVADNGNYQGRQANRRVEFVIER